jgi:hypothetical protein
MKINISTFYEPENLDNINHYSISDEERQFSTSLNGEPKIKFSKTGEYCQEYIDDPEMLTVKYTKLKNDI